MSFRPTLFRGERLALNSEIRSKLPGSFIQLSDGVCHYELAGPEDGPIIVLIHGFSVPYFIWNPSFEFFTEQGFRVLRYDLFGRGFSDRPRVKNTRAFFQNQLLELLAALSISQKISLISLSMGALIAADFATEYPEKIKRLIFIDPAGFDLKLPWQVNALRIPLVGEILLGGLGLFGGNTLLQSMLSDFYQPSQEAIDFFVPAYMEQMKYRGFKWSLLSTLREGFLDEDNEVFRRLADRAYPVQLIWGREDRTIPFAQHEAFLEMLPGTSFQAIDKAGHIPHFERPEVVHSLMLDFLNSSLQ